MEPNGHYLGALDAYVAAPFVGLFGSNLLAIRLPLAILGGVYVAVMYWLGRLLFKRTDYALVTALVAAVFPLFTVFWSAKLRGGYAELPIFEALALALCAQIGWGQASKLRLWAALGFTTGIALWSDLLFVIVAAVVALGLLVRGQAIGWPTWRRGAGVAVAASVVGLAPWLAFNLPNNLSSLHSIPKNYVGFRTGVGNLLSEHLPILVGGSSSCGHDVVPAIVSDSALGLLAVAVLVMRRRTLARVFSGRFSGIEPLDLVYVLMPATLIFLVVSRLNYDPCQPRYITPLAVPLVVAVVSVLVARWPWRAIGVAAAAVWLVISGVAAAGPLVDMHPATPTGAAIPADLGPGLAMINREHPSALWAQYWLSRPLSYASGDTLAIGNYGGYVGFIERQQQVETTANPSWAFVEGDTEAAAFERVCVGRGVKYRNVSAGGIVLYTGLSATIEPGDVFSGSEAKTA
jgi:4-amino-4-deoxy-L-arabinose transferase-like glycosyltransferase